MKDIPLFTTENGVASLILKEVPVRGLAYIKLQASSAPALLLDECVGFCRACGAERIMACGEGIDGYPVAAVLVEMQASGLEGANAAVFPVTEETVGRWRNIYNERMAGVPNAAWMTVLDEKKLLEDGDCYFVHKEGELLGIGKAGGEVIDMIASVKRGCGETVLLAMASLLDSDSVRLTVAQENRSAMRLYERLGFTAMREVSRWYKIL